MKADQMSVTVSQDLIALYYVLSDEFSSPHLQTAATELGEGIAIPFESRPSRYGTAAAATASPEWRLGRDCKESLS